MLACTVLYVLADTSAYKLAYALADPLPFAHVDALDGPLPHTLASSSSKAAFRSTPPA